MVGGFNPRLPGGRRRQKIVKKLISSDVSIHAFRGEGDAASTRDKPKDCKFQSTPSGGKATWVWSVEMWYTQTVSIHAFRGEGDSREHEWVWSGDVSIHAFRGEGDLRVAGGVLR